MYPMLVPAGIACPTCGGIGLVYVPADLDFKTCHQCMGWCFLEDGWIDSHPVDAKPAPGFYTWRGSVVRDGSPTFVNEASGEIETCVVSPTDLPDPR